ncbi:hypothetical protein [Paenibacillus sabinae]|uniref:Uncharacterized protein n=1 Tax=Paenibacillus sabinae T27 TaxID=1268072 RepID=X4ZI78_9BACL|nr:hypothetical protein [Paenibacillus sabinae]AHV97077.1 hypothetical protein PSAB_10735 [Paenibacillus sabinae T27]
MEAFMMVLDKVIDSMIKLEAEWERIENTHSDYLDEHYRLSSDWRETVHQMMEWRNQIREE